MPTGGREWLQTFFITPSQSGMKPLFFHTPGLKIVYLPILNDCEGMLNAALEDPILTSIFEATKACNAPSVRRIPDEHYSTVNRPKQLSQNRRSDFHYHSTALGVHWALKQWKNWGFPADILDSAYTFCLGIKKAVKAHG